MFVSLVDWEKCKGCGDCVGACPVNCYKLTDGKSLPHRSSYCLDCGSCPDICPSGAITISIGWGGQPVGR